MEALIDQLLIDYQRSTMIQLTDDFARKTVYGALSALWKTKLKEGIAFEETEDFQAEARKFLRRFLVIYMNEGVENMVTSGEDTYFMENFGRMKGIMNHGYRCLLVIVMTIIKLTVNQVDLSEVKFDKEKMDFVNLNEALDKVFARYAEVKQQNFFKHKCESTDEDITQWDPKQPFFPSNYLEEEEENDE